MHKITIVAVALMFLIPPVRSAENPWKDRVAPAVKKVAQSPTAAAYREALDVAYRADDWRTGLRLAREAMKRFPDLPELRGVTARALWRAGKVADATGVVDRIALDTTDRTALSVVIEIDLARGEYAAARRAAAQLEKLGPKTASQYYATLSLRLADNRLEGIPVMLRRAAKLVDPAHGYPETYLAEVFEGLPEFFEAIGPKPFNTIAEFGEAEMPVAPLLNLPYCVATINGHGPYRLIVDTGGSITLSLADQVADELGLASLGTASVRGISGKQESRQMLVDALRIGGITCRRVMTRSFAMPGVMKAAADGIIGTGVFTEGRMTLDFGNARLIVAPSSDKPAAGHLGKLLIVGDAKLMAPIGLEGRPAVALLDSGADVTAVSVSRLRELFPDHPLKQALAAGGVGIGQGQTAGLRLAPGVDLDLWGRRFDNYSGIGLDTLDDLLCPILGVQTDVLIGMPIFRDMRVWTVDFPRRKMWVQWLSETPH